MLSKKSHREADGRLDIPAYPPPWSLKVSSSWVFPYLFNPKKHTALLRGDELSTHYRPGLGIAMIVSYGESPAGPYDELVFAVPYKHESVKGEIVSPCRLPTIYVSSEASLRNGRVNWGIKKELADFQWTERTGFLHTKTSLCVKDRYSRETLFEGSMITFSLPCFPAPLGLLGRLCPLIVEPRINEEGERVGHDWLGTRMTGFGWARLSIVFLTSVIGKLWLKFGLNMRGTLNFPIPEVIRG